MERRNMACRYGLNCRKIKNGCNFQHRNQENRRGEKKHAQMQESGEKKQFRENSHHYHHSGKKEKGSQEETDLPNGPVHRKRQRQRSRSESRKNEGRKQFKKDYYQLPYYKRQYSRSRPKQSTQQQQFRRHENIQAFICREYQIQDKCAYSPNCKKMHGFMPSQPTKIKRLIFNQKIPLCSASTMTVNLDNNNELLYIIRGKKAVYFFKYFPEVNRFESLAELAEGRTDMTFFKNIGLTFYCSFKNACTEYEDISIHNIPNDENYFIANTHTRAITGIEELNQSTLLSTSLDGQLKAWSIDRAEKAVQSNAELTRRFKICYNPKEGKLSLNFIQKTPFGPDILLSVGTNDSRVLLFSSNSALVFKSIELSLPQLSVVQTKFVIRSGKIEGIFALANDANKHYIFKGSSLEDRLSLIYMRSRSDVQQICCFSVYEDLLMVAEHNKLSIYRLPDTKLRVGCILHKFKITAFSLIQYELKTTAVKFHLLTVLSPPPTGLDQNGTLGIYLVR